MSDVLIAREELDFLLWDWLGLDRVIARHSHDMVDRESADAILDLSARLAADSFLTHYKDADRIEPSLHGGGVHALPEIGALAVMRAPELRPAHEDARRFVRR